MIYRFFDILTALFDQFGDILSGHIVLDCRAIPFEAQSRLPPNRLIQNSAPYGRSVTFVTFRTQNRHFLRHAILLFIISGLHAIYNHHAVILARHMV
jgi:hypothetical protein